MVMLRIETFRWLEQQSAMASPGVRFDQALQNADALRHRLQHWQEQQGITAETVIETLHTLREEQDASVAGRW